MKLRLAILILLATLLSACNMSLAEDVTPPPGYIPPTPVPTLVLFPPETPNAANGEAIYFEKCAPCHGQTGLGDGPQGIQLGVTVPAFALPEVARPSSPAAWYTIVTRGKIERFMPPFASLNDQERWDVVAYITTLHTSEEEIQRGKEIFETACPECSTDYFEDQTRMSGFSTVALARIVRLGNEEIPAFGENLSDEEMWAVAEYLRSLTYDTSLPVAPAPASATQTPLASDAGSPSAGGTPVGTEQAQAAEEPAPLAEGFGNVSGFIDNRTGAALPGDLSVTLRGYEHDFANPSAGTQEILTLEGAVASDGSFVFENVEMPENRIFLAEVTFNGVEVNSEFVIVEAGQTRVELPPLVLYNVTEDTSALTVDELNIFFSAESDSVYEILALYRFRNNSQSIISVPVGSQQEIPFLRFPVGAQGIGYEAVQDSARFISTADGFAMAPSDMPYGILAFSSVAREREISISQPLELAVTHVRIFVPDGMKVESDNLQADSPQSIQGLTYQPYIGAGFNAGDVLTFTVSGSPKDTASGTNALPVSNTALLIGAGGLGIALIAAGAWMYLRDRRRLEEEEDEEDEDEDDDEEEFESSEDVMDAIIALDDLYRAKKISDEAYQKRRAELKDILKEMI
jgi:mono/diheme cytochrome c family protein